MLLSNFVLAGRHNGTALVEMVLMSCLFACFTILKNSDSKSGESTEDGNPLDLQDVRNTSIVVEMLDDLQWPIM